MTRKTDPYWWVIPVALVALSAAYPPFLGFLILLGLCGLLAGNGFENKRPWDETGARGYQGDI